MEKTRGEIHTAVKESITTDTLHTATAASEESRDSTEVRSDERAIIKIKRDSVGRIVEINAARNEKVSANIKRKTERDRWFYGLNATRYSEASDSVDSFTQTKKEEKKDHKFGTTLGAYIGLSLFAFIILFYIGYYIYRLWKRKVGK